jgi:hypothetical protein
MRSTALLNHPAADPLRMRDAGPQDLRHLAMRECHISSSCKQDLLCVSPASDHRGKARSRIDWHETSTTSSPIYTDERRSVTYCEKRCIIATVHQTCVLQPFSDSSRLHSPGTQSGVPSHSDSRTCTRALYHPCPSSYANSPPLDLSDLPR